MKRVMLTVISAVFVFASIASGHSEQGDWHEGNSVLIFHML